MAPGLITERIMNQCKNSTILLLLWLTPQVMSQQLIVLNQFQKSKQTTDLSRWENNRLILETKEQHASGWFYYPQAIKLKGLEKAEIEVTVELPSKDACIEIGSSVNPQAKNGFNTEKTFVRFYNTFGDVGGNLYLQHRKNFEPYQGEYLKPFPTGAHSLKMTAKKDSIILFLLSNGIWQRLKSLQNPLPDSFYVAVTASERGKWILAAGQIVLTPTPIKPPIPKIVYGGKVTMVWNPANETKVRYRAHLGLASRSYPMSWITPDTFFVFTNLDTGRVYFGAVTAIDSAGNESAYSDEVSFVRRDTTKADPLDLTGDKRVNLADYTLLKLGYGKSGKGDFDMSGIIDELDFLWFWRFGKFDAEN